MKTKLADDWYHCHGCKSNMPASGFYRSGAHGMQSVCKECQRKSAKLWKKAAPLSEKNLRWLGKKYA